MKKVRLIEYLVSVSASLSGTRVDHMLLSLLRQYLIFVSYIQIMPTFPLFSFHRVASIWYHCHLASFVHASRRRSIPEIKARYFSLPISP